MSAGQLAVRANTRCGPGVATTLRNAPNDSCSSRELRSSTNACAIKAWELVVCRLAHAAASSAASVSFCDCEFNTLFATSSAVISKTLLDVACGCAGLATCDCGSACSCGCGCDGAASDKIMSAVANEPSSNEEATSMRSIARQVRATCCVL